MNPYESPEPEEVVLAELAPERLSLYARRQVFLAWFLAGVGSAGCTVAFMSPSQNGAHIAFAGGVALLLIGGWPLCSNN